MLPKSSGGNAGKRHELRVWGPSKGHPNSPGVAPRDKTEPGSPWGSSTYLQPAGKAVKLHTKHMQGKQHGERRSGTCLVDKNPPLWISWD